MESSLKTLIDSARGIERWARRAETTAARLSQDHDTDIQTAERAITAGLLPYPVARLVMPLAQVAQKGLSRFANSVEQSFGHMVSWHLGTTTLLDIPRF
jgi:hypothetical protein